MEITRGFDTRVVLTALTGILLTKRTERDNGITSLYELLNWMTDDDIYTHQIPRVCRECAVWLERWFPWVAEAGRAVKKLEFPADQQAAEAMIAEWVKRSKLPDVCMVPKLPKGEHERKDAYDELVQKVGSDEKVAVVRR